MLVNNAGITSKGRKDILHATEESWDAVFDTNLKGAFWGAKAAAAAMSDNGCIINISSIAGKRGSTNNSMYCASKFAMNGLTQALAKELGPKGFTQNKKRENRSCLLAVHYG